MSTTSHGDATSPSRLRAIIYACGHPGEEPAIEEQFSACRAWASKRGIPVASVHGDSGLRRFGRRTSYPGRSRALLRLRPGDVLVVFSPDRLFRSGKELIRLNEAISKKGCTIALAGLSDVESRLIFGTLVELAQMEREYEASRR